MASTAPVAPGDATESWPTRLGITQRRLPLLVAAAGSVVAAAVHAILIGDHWRYWAPAGAFFLVCTGVQIIAAAAVLGRPTERVLLGVVTANVVVIAVYVVSRTAGIPGAPGIAAHGSIRSAGVPIIPGTVERVGGQDLLALAAEVIVVMCAAVCLAGRARRWAMNGLMGFGLALVGLSAAGVLA